MHQSKLAGASKSVAIFLIVAMLLGTVAIAADSAVSSTLRLEVIEGTITLKNAAGNTITAREGMKLNNGYKITTSSSSYAYISLDDDKVVKLDSLTTCTVKKKGEQLELLLSTGKLFFNVTAPLKETETMTVRTSSMVTGIRGTSGFVELNENGSEVSLLSGRVEVSSVKQGTTEVETEILEAGFKASVEEQSGNAPEITPLTEEIVPAFVKVEVEKDEELQAVVQEQSGLDSNTLIENAQEELKAEEEKQEAIVETAQAEIDVEAEENEKLDEEAAEEEEPSRPSSGGSSDDDSDGNVSPTVLFTGSTFEELITQLSVEGVKNVVISGEKDITISESALIPTGKGVYIQSGADVEFIAASGTPQIQVEGSLVVSDGGELKIGAGIQTFILSNNSFILNGNATLEDVLYVGSTSLGKSARVYISSGDKLTVNQLSVEEGILSNDGILEITNSDASKMTCYNNGEITNNTALSEIKVSQDLRSVGKITNQGKIEVADVFLNDFGGEFTNGNSASITANQIQNQGVMTLNGTVETEGSFLNLEDNAASTFGTVVNNGDVTANGGFGNAGRFTNEAYGTLTVGGELTAPAGVQLHNTGTIINKGDITLSDKTLENTGVFDSGSGDVEFNGCLVSNVGELFLLKTSGLISKLSNNVDLISMRFDGERGNGYMYEQSLQAVFDSAVDGDTISLYENTALSDSFNGLIIDNEIELNLGGFTFDLGVNPSDTQEARMTIDNDVTIVGGNGKLISSDDKTVLVSSGSELTINGVEISNSSTDGSAVSLEDGTSTLNFVKGFITKDTVGEGYAVDIMSGSPSITYAYAAAVARAKDKTDVISSGGTVADNADASGYFIMTNY